jgi:hypothetical protein
MQYFFRFFFYFFKKSSEKHVSITALHCKNETKPVNLGLLYCEKYMYSGCRYSWASSSHQTVQGGF